MSIVLQPGITAPAFVLPAPNLGREVSLKEYAGKKVVLIFFPAGLQSLLVEQLGKYQAAMPGLEQHEALILGISDATKDELKRLGENPGWGYIQEVWSFRPGPRGSSQRFCDR
jgi:peroxiredoxin Q/BCP